jgi:hypothetical protein
MIANLRSLSTPLVVVTLLSLTLFGCAEKAPIDLGAASGHLDDGHIWDRSATGVQYTPLDTGPVAQAQNRRVKLAVRKAGVEFVNTELIAKALRDSLESRGYIVSDDAPVGYEVSVSHFSAEWHAGFAVPVTGTADWNVAVTVNGSVSYRRRFIKRETETAPAAGIATGQVVNVLTKCLQENVQASTSDQDLTIAIVTATASATPGDRLPPPGAASSTASIPEPPRSESPDQLPGSRDRPAYGSSERRFAVVIGISGYKDSRIPALRYAEADAKSVGDWLTSEQGGRYALADVKLLLGKDATAEAIRKAMFQWLGQALAEDVVTIYFSGHGTPASPNESQNLFLVPYDTDYEQIAATAFPMWDIETALKRFIKARRVIVIADACHAGGVGSGFADRTRSIAIEGASAVTGGIENLSKVNDGVAVITSAADNQLSLESERWGGGHGVFTYFLLKGLQGEADYNHDGKVTLGELSLYLSEQVRRETRSEQSPEVAGKFDPALTVGK